MARSLVTPVLKEIERQALMVAECVLALECPHNESEHQRLILSRVLALKIIDQMAVYRGRSQA